MAVDYAKCQFQFPDGPVNSFNGMDLSQLNSGGITPRTPCANLQFSYTPTPGGGTQPFAYPTNSPYDGTSMSSSPYIPTPTSHGSAAGTPVPLAHLPKIAPFPKVDHTRSHYSDLWNLSPSTVTSEMAVRRREEATQQPASSPLVQPDSGWSETQPTPKPVCKPLKKSVLADLPYSPILPSGGKQLTLMSILNQRDEQEPYIPEISFDDDVLEFKSSAPQWNTPQLRLPSVADNSCISLNDSNNTFNLGNITENHSSNSSNFHNSSNFDSSNNSKQSSASQHNHSPLTYLTNTGDDSKAWNETNHKTELTKQMTGGSKDALVPSVSPPTQQRQHECASCGSRASASWRWEATSESHLCETCAANDELFGIDRSAQRRTQLPSRTPPPPLNLITPDPSPELPQFKPAVVHQTLRVSPETTLDDVVKAHIDEATESKYTTQQTTYQSNKATAKSTANTTSKPTPTSTETKPTKVVACATRVCANCATTKSSMWRKGGEKMEDVMCNPCGLYWKNHKEQRPQSMWSSVIKRRIVKNRDTSARHTPKPYDYAPPAPIQTNAPYYDERADAILRRFSEQNPLGATPKSSLDIAARYGEPRNEMANPEIPQRTQTPPMFGVLIPHGFPTPSASPYSLAPSPFGYPEGPSQLQQHYQNVPAPMPPPTSNPYNPYQQSHFDYAHAQQLYARLAQTGLVQLQEQQRAFEAYNLQQRS